MSENLEEIANETEVSNIKRIKVLSLGDPRTGKSCLIKRYCETRFIEEYIPTIGIDYGVRNFETKLSEEVKINFWDTGGAEYYFDIRSEFYKDTDGAFLVFDLSNRVSFDNLEKWHREFIDSTGGFSTGRDSRGTANQSQTAELELELDEEKENRNEIILYIIGNKLDSQDRQVSTKEAIDFSKKLGGTYYETSAKSGQSIDEMFESLFYNSLALKYPEYQCQINHV